MDGGLLRPPFHSLRSTGATGAAAWPLVRPPLGPAQAFLSVPGLPGSACPALSFSQAELFFSLRLLCLAVTSLCCCHRLPVVIIFAIFSAVTQHPGSSSPACASCPSCVTWVPPPGLSPPGSAAPLQHLALPLPFQPACQSPRALLLVVGSWRGTRAWHIVGAQLCAGVSICSLPGFCVPRGLDSTALSPEFLFNVQAGWVKLPSPSHLQTDSYPWRFAELWDGRLEHSRRPGSQRPAAQRVYVALISSGCQVAWKPLSLPALD